MCEGYWIVIGYVGFYWILCNFICVVKSCSFLLTSLKEIVLLGVTIKVLTFATVDIKIQLSSNDWVLLLCFFNF